MGSTIVIGASLIFQILTRMTTSLLLPVESTPPTIGQLYDARTDTYKEFRLIRSREISKYIEEITMTNFRLKHTVVQTQSDFFKVKNIAADVQLNYRLGVVSGDSNAGFNSMVQQKSSARTVLGYIYYEQQTVKQFVNFCDRDVRAHLEISYLNGSVVGVTHAVKGLIYGCKSDLTLATQCNDDSIKTVLEAELAHNMADAIGRVNLGVRLSQKSEVRKSRSETKYSVQVVSNIPTGMDIPTKFEDIVPYMQNMGTHLNNTKNGIGSPIYAELISIADLRACHGIHVVEPQYREIEKHVFVNVSKALDDTERNLQRMNDIKRDMEDFSPCFCNDLHLNVSETFTELKWYSEKFRSDLRAKLIGLRSMSENDEMLESEIDDYYNNDLSPRNFQETISHRFPNLEDTLHLYKLGRDVNITCVIAHNSIFQHIFNSANDYNFFFEFDELSHPLFKAGAFAMAGIFAEFCQKVKKYLPSHCFLLDCQSQSECGREHYRVYQITSNRVTHFMIAKDLEMQVSRVEKSGWFNWG